MAVPPETMFRRPVFHHAFRLSTSTASHVQASAVDIGAHVKAFAAFLLIKLQAFAWSFRLCDSFAGLRISDNH